MLIVYTGDGKGKTSAAAGQTLRALGWGFRVCFGQFMKRDNQAGEQIMLKKMLARDFCSCGSGFFLQENQRNEQREAAAELLDWCRRKIRGRPDMLVLDEALYALGMGLVSREELAGLIRLCRKENVHLLLTGRNAPDWVVQEADLVSDIQVVKHPFQEGKKATMGIEF
ncbi:MAG: cob(I)yrinic acid a,c-diamide adenosyltransferase [Desulfonatronovibrionaceae bacterium]